MPVLPPHTELPASGRCRQKDAVCLLADRQPRAEIAMEILSSLRYYIVIVINNKYNNINYRNIIL